MISSGVAISSIIKLSNSMPNDSHLKVLVPVMFKYFDIWILLDIWKFLKKLMAHFPLRYLKLNSCYIDIFLFYNRGGTVFTDFDLGRKSKYQFKCPNILYKNRLYLLKRK